jgi:hypothetical protein
MAATLYLGKSGRSRFTIPVGAATETIAILAKRGAGKTYLASVMAEEMLRAGVQVVIIDPLDVWWGLRSSADGKSAGIPIIVFGGDKADIPIEGSEGAATADAIVDNGLSAILSIRHLSKGKQLAFVTAFATRLYERKGQRGNRSALHLMIDEADAFAPQRLRPESARCMGAVDDLVRRGRASGIGVTLITQRSAALNKDLLTQTELLICMRTTGPQDRKAVKAWIDEHDVDEDAKHRQRMFMGSLIRLAVGEAWFWCPGWLSIFERVKVRRRTTFDSSATPKMGARTRQPKRMASVDLEVLRKSLAASIEAAENTDPSALRKKLALRDKAIAHLQSKLDQGNGCADPRAIAQAVEKEATRIHAQCRDDFSAWVDRARARLRDAFNASVLDGLQGDSPVEPACAKGRQIIPNPIPPQPTQRSKVTTPHRQNDQSFPANAQRPRSGKLRMLVACAQFPDGIPDRKVAMLAGLSSKSGTFSTYLGNLRTLGFIEGPNICIRVTQAGIDSAGDFQRLPVGDALREFWRTKLPGSGVMRLFDAICKAYPKAISKEAAGSAAALSSVSGTFSTYLGKLRTLNLLDRADGGPDFLLASGELFG